MRSVVVDDNGEVLRICAPKGDSGRLRACCMSGEGGTPRSDGDPACPDATGSVTSLYPSMYPSLCSSSSALLSAANGLLPVRTSPWPPGICASPCGPCRSVCVDLGTALAAGERAAPPIPTAV